MMIDLVSNDAALYKACTEILAEIPQAAQSWTVRLVSPMEATGEADLFIWDFQPNLPLPDETAWSPLRYMFLVDRNDLAALRERTGAGDSNVLLKPVAQETLAAFLIAAISSGVAKSLSADRDEILQCLIQTNVKLQQFDEERAAFLARALDDFRAPLTALGGYCGLLLSEALGPLKESQSEVLRRMQNSSRRLSRMASAMLELSVRRKVRKRADLRPGDIREALQQALREIAPFADEKSISITADMAPCDHGLYFEAALIQEVLVNILDNACRFTPRAGVVEIRGYPCFIERRVQHPLAPPAIERRRRTTREPNGYRVDISDSGALLPDEHLARIFEEHAASAGGRDRSGGGLGLAICKLIIAQHEGRIWAENRDLGPVFSFVLPIRSSDPRLPAAASLGSAREEV